MAKKITLVFMTQADQALLLRSLDAARPIEAIKAGAFDGTPSLSGVQFEALQPFAMYLLVDKGAEVRVRPVPQQGGGVRYMVDQLENPDAVVLHCGGLLADDHLVAGQFGTLGDSERALGFYSLLSKTLRSQGEKIKSYCVGREAADLLSKGARLSPTSKSLGTYDLRR